MSDLQQRCLHGIIYRVFITTGYLITSKIALIYANLRYIFPRIFIKELLKLS